MVTLFTIPKPNSNSRIDIIQQNAFGSWRQLGFPEVFLLGDETGVKDYSKKFGYSHISNVKRNKFGTPLLSSAFELVRKKSRNNLLMFVNADIILLPDLKNIFSLLLQKEFLVVGQRWDMDIDYKINFNKADWLSKLEKDLSDSATLHRPAGSDYFIFNKSSFQNMPDFAVGRIGWDNWMIYEARRLKMPVIDATLSVKIIHQNHNYGHYNLTKDIRSGPEALENILLAGGKNKIFTIADSNWIIKNLELTPKKISLKRHIYYLRFCPEVLL